MFTRRLRFRKKLRSRNREVIIDVSGSIYFRLHPIALRVDIMSIGKKRVEKKSQLIKIKSVR